MDHTHAKEGVSHQNQRRSTHPKKYAEELKWFSGFNRPDGLLHSPQLDNLESFKRLIWDNPSTTIIPEFNCSVDEMADLCCNGWVSTSHILWMTQKVNQAQDTCLCLCLPGDTPDIVSQSIKRGRLSNINKLVFIINVGKLPDNSVYIGSGRMSGCHWVMTIVNLDGPTVLYCDSSAWGSPPDLLQVLSQFTALFGVPALLSSSRQLAHVETASGCLHQCSVNNCIRYPLQSCSDVCGILSLIMMVIAATDPGFFFHVLQSPEDLFIHSPSHFSGFLRRIVIYWFVSGTPSTKFLQQVPNITDDHTYARKRRDMRQRSSHGTKKRRNQTDTFLSSGHLTDQPPVSTASMSDHVTKSATSSSYHKKPALSSDQPPVSTASMSDHVTKSATSSSYHKKPAPSSDQPPVSTASMSDHVTKSATSSSYHKKPAPLSDQPPVSTVSMSDHVTKSATSSSYHKKPAPLSDQPPVSTVFMSDHVSQSDPSSSRHPSKSASSLSGHHKEYVCSFCNKRLATRQSLSVHKKNKHAGQIQTDRVHNYGCQSCDVSISCVRNLINHYKDVHQRDHCVMRATFTSEEKFFEWKKEIEKSTFSRFVKMSGKQSSKDTVTNYFYCHRSGAQTRQIIDRKRSQKSQGSCKSGNKCIAYIISRQNIMSGTVNVEYCLDHIGHRIQMCHLKMSDELRNTIAAKLAQGLEVGKVLTELRDKLTEINRDTLITRKDIYNILKQFNITRTQRHANDKVSVDLWVSEFSRDVDNPIIFYKSQGNQDELLKEEDMLLCLQTKFQKEMLLKYHSKIICADSTHKTNQYDFLLTSLLVLDDHEEAIPVAWAISNREDSDVLEIFLGAVRDVCGQDLPTQIFMSDLACNFYIAWCAVFTKPGKRLYCSWHVDKSWRKQIRSQVAGKETQSLVYGYLKTIQTEADEAKFCKMLAEFFTFLSTEAPDFLNYFSKQYVHNKKTACWASCYRLGTLANTNMFAEAFHRTLKVVYFNRKQNRRVDSLLFVLLKLARDKAVEQLIKSEKGKITHRKKEIRKRHLASKDVREENITNVGEEEWAVLSASATGIIYNIKKVSSHEHCKCQLLCESCSACVHMYTCTCNDYLIRTVMCKHIHAVHMKIKSPDISSTCTFSDSDVELDQDENNDFYKSVLCQNKPEKNCDLEKVRAAALSTTSDIVQFLQSTKDLSAAQTACTRLGDVLSILRGMQSLAADSQKDFDKTETFPANKNFERQPRFYSTKAKPKSTGRERLKLKKPGVQQQQELQYSLSSYEALVCNVCLKEDDPVSGSDAPVQWRNCDSCNAWTHNSCDCSPTFTNREEYICPLCL